LENESAVEGMMDGSLTMIKALAQKLQTEGFEVLANHPEWVRGNPIPVFGIIPDVVAMKGHQRYTFLVEDEVSLLNISQLQHRLAALLQFPRENVYLVIPLEIVWQGRAINPVRQMRERLQNWGYRIKMATYDGNTQSFNFNPWKDLRATGRG
jgi:hypothetical protein